MNNNDDDALLHHDHQHQQQQGVTAYQPNDNNNPQQQQQHPRGRGGRTSAEERHAEMENEPPLTGYQRYVIKILGLFFAQSSILLS